MRQPSTIREVVENGLCIGCGLCEALSPGLAMRMTPEGRERPHGRATDDEEARILSACPGAVMAADAEEGAEVDPVWGALFGIEEAWAGDPTIRFQAATGGVLTALGQFALSSGRARFALHVSADPEAPMRSRWRISETPEEVAGGMGSRYGPAAPLAGLETALAREEPFVFIGKPCDAGALRRLAKSDPRVDRRCVAILVMVCGGASELGKSEELLAQLGWREEELALFRYRGFGNPGPTRIETRDGRVHEVSYNALWEDEGSWRLQSRCKICADAIGEAADVAAADIWPGGSPVGEDEGFNGVLLRTNRGRALFEAAVASGALETGRTLTPRDMDDFQPHQVRKKRALLARLEGLAEAGRPVPQVSGLRIEALAAEHPDLAGERAGAAARARAGKFSEPFSDR